MKAFNIFISTLIFFISSLANANEKIKFSLDWKFEGPSAIFLTSKERGYYKSSGLDVTIDSGKGSRDAIPKVASGTYPLGFADINSVIKFLDQNPKAKVKAIMMVYDRPPFAIIGRKSLGVVKPKDLEGKILGAPAPDGAYAQWKSFVKANNINASKVKIENVGFPVREPMLASGKVQAITGFSFSSYINLASKGVSEDDISLMLMADYGLKLYGNAVIVNTDFAKAKPNIVKTFLSTTIKGMKEMIADPASTIPHVLKYNKIAKAKTETTRLKMAIRDNIVTDAVKTNGIGSVDMNRLNESIKQLSETYSFKTKMDGSKVFDDSYLPDSFKRKL